MMLIVNFVLTLILLVVIPFILGSGLLSTEKGEELMFSHSTVMGLLVMLAVFAIECIPLGFLNISFRMLVLVYMITLLAICAVIVWKQHKVLISVCKKAIRFWSHMETMELIIVIAIAVLAILQLFLVHQDADDSEYVAMVGSTIRTNGIMTVDALTGQEAIYVSLKRVIAPFPIWMSACSYVTASHPAVFCHTIFPALMIVVAFWCYDLVGKLLFKDTKKKNIFLLVLLVCLVFGNYSTFSFSSRLFMRAWQGKSVLAFLGIPLVTVLLIGIAKEKIRWQQFLILFVVVLGCTVTSSMANVLLPVLISCFALVQAIYKRSVLEFIKTECTFLPCILFIGLYILA